MGLPQTPEDQCLDLGVRLHKAHTSPQRLRTAQCCESCAPARSHPSTRGPDVVVFQPPDPMVPAPQTTAPPPLQKLQRSPAIPRQQTSQGGALTCGPFSFLQAGGRLPVPSWDFGGGTLAVSAQLAHPSRAPEQCLHPPPASTSSASSSAPLPTSAMFLLRPLPPKNQEGSVKSTPFPRSGLSPAPVREDPGGPRLPAGSRAGPERCRASTFPAPGARRPAEHPFLRATSSAPTGLAPPSNGFRLEQPANRSPQPASAWDPHVGGVIPGQSCLVGGVTSQTKTLPVCRPS